MSMICAKIYGGLGNQMFQYALGLRLAQDRKAELTLDTSFFTPEYIHAYNLDKLRIEARLLSAREMASLRPLAERLPFRLPSRLARLLPVCSAVPVVREKAFPFDPSVLETRAPAYLDGYWQTEKYFSSIADKVRAHFQLAAPMTASRSQAVADIVGKNAVSVHVRRGDYVTNPQTLATHGACTPEWYAQAMQKMAETVERPHFFIFSNDPAWVRANMPQLGPTTYIDPQDDRRDFEDLHMMAQCRHHIIANSTFSWWGAWLNPSPDKKVIAPARWFANSPNDTRDLIPETWMRL